MSELSCKLLLNVISFGYSFYYQMNLQLGFDLDLNNYLFM